MEMDTPPAAWYADPSGRHQHRYWTGSAWTEHVADQGRASVDPLPASTVAPTVEQQVGRLPRRQQQAGQAPQPPSRPGGGTGQPADLGPRFVARLLDFILLGVVNSIISGSVTAGLVMGAHVSIFSAWGAGRTNSYLANALSALISAVISLGYFALMESGRGQTLGKMLVKLETRGPGGGRPTIEQAFKRNAFTAIPVLGVVPFLGAVSGLLTLVAVITIAVAIRRDATTHRGWHDDFAGGTTVVRIG